MTTNGPTQKFEFLTVCSLWVFCVYRACVYLFAHVFCFYMCVLLSYAFVWWSRYVLFVSLCVFAWLRAWLRACLPVCPHTYLPACLPACVPLCLRAACLPLFVCLPVFVCLSACLCLPVCLSVYLIFCVFVRLLPLNCIVVVVVFIFVLFLLFCFSCFIVVLHRIDISNTCVVGCATAQCAASFCHRKRQVV